MIGESDSLPHNLQEDNAEGNCVTIAAHYGTSQCYNVLPINDAASAFQVFNGPNTNAVGLELFYDIDCTGTSTQVRKLYSPTMPAGFDNQITSCTHPHSLSLSRRVHSFL
jgi:hypothetical protein